MISFLPVIGCALIDWFAVARENKRLEYVTKPLTMLLLIAVLAGIGVGGGSEANVAALFAALILSLAGDVFLMLPDLFLPGLASFLLAHIAYIVAFAPAASFSLPWTISALALVVLGGLVGRRIVAGLTASGRAGLRAPVLVYMVAITAMVLTVVASGQWWAILGALSFYASDSLIGWSRFVEPLRWAPVAIMVTYHLGQIGLVAGARAL